MSAGLKLKVLVSAGATREPIDAVRFLSNYSTGVFGYCIATQAQKRGHRVILISGPASLPKPPGVRSIDVETARQMEKQLKEKFDWCNCLIMNAAVCDFRAKRAKRSKIKRSPGKGKGKSIILKLRQNPDILTDLAKQNKEGRGRDTAKKILVGFALETENLKKNAQAKLRNKDLDLIVAIQMSAKQRPFGKTKIEALIIDKGGRIEQVAKTDKSRLAQVLLKRLECLYLQSIKFLHGA